ncbi:MAG: restriction alleviation protein, Lar family [Mesorhizobium sp.]|uniref:Lar family restriction alleviation protein n=1 Tax=Mesorhizobium sp. TaxID=1871066 RepID=UPI0011FE8234|nr:Lar family restriction alleviation protein [Mesorhizobium sp.]TJV51101.1 MAG: restriction alleviation protein, Lar family [Mesorhizobium sp.]
MSGHPTPDLEAALEAAMLPCPFCGSQPELYISCNEDGAELGFMYRCEECGVEKEAEWKHEAIAAWNQRAAARLSVPEAGKAADETLTALSGFLVFLKDMRFTGSWDVPTLNRAIEVGETIASQSRSPAAPEAAEPAAMRDALKEANAFILAPAEDLKEGVLSRIRAALAAEGRRP